MNALTLFDTSPTAAVDLVLMTRAEARQCADAIKLDLANARRRLLDLYEREGWRALGYDSWRACAMAEFRQSQAYLYRQLRAAEIERELSPIGEIRLTESHARELAAIPDPETRADVWQEAVAQFGQPTAKEIADVRENRQHFHQVATSSASPEWYTPREILDAVIAVLGAIDLDPCSNSHEAPNVPATWHYTKDDDGLLQSWAGRVYMNPPYGTVVGQWVDHLLQEVGSGRVTEAVVLVKAAFEADWCKRLCRHASRLSVWGRRLSFIGPDSEGWGAPYGSLIAYFGPQPGRFDAVFHQHGIVFTEWLPQAGAAFASLDLFAAQEGDDA